MSGNTIHNGELQIKGSNGQGGLFVLGSLYPHVTGGMEMFNYYFLQNLPGNDSSVIYYLGSNSPSNEKVMYVPMKSRKPVRFFYPFQFFFAVWKLRKKVSYAYISYAEQSWIIPAAQSLILKFFKLPYIITIHWGKSPEWNFRLPFHYYFRNAHTIVGVSEPVCEAYRKIFPGKKIVYIPPVIPFSKRKENSSVLKEKLGIAGNSYVILFAGALKQMKNPDKIIEALSIIGHEFLEKNNVVLLLAGQGHMEDFLKQKTAHLNLSSHIKFAGLVPRNDMPDYFGAADCYIISSDYEGTSISLMEAMFNQLPIIGTNAPGINHMLSHERNALLYQANDAEQLASHIKAMIIDRSSAGRLAKNAGQDFENKYSYGKMIEQYRNLFASLPFGPKRQYQPDSVNRMAIEGSKEFNKNEKVKL